MDGNVFEDLSSMRATRAVETLTKTVAKQWAFDFSSVLLLPEVPLVVSYAFAQTDAASMFVPHAVQTMGNGSIVVYSQMAVSATVTVTVENIT